MNHDDIWARYFNLPVLPQLPPAPRRSFWDRLFPRCVLCGEMCSELFS